MKRMSTKEILVDSFFELAASTPVSKITVRSIVENCNYSPATFYRHFADKFDLIAWSYEHDLASIMARIGDGGHRWRQILLDVARYFQAQRPYIANLLSGTSGLDAFVNTMGDAGCRQLQRLLECVVGEENLGPHVLLCIRLYCQGAARVIEEWVLGNLEATPEAIAAALEDAVPVPLRPYLCPE